MFDHLKRYSSFALCILLLNITFFFPAHLIAEEVISQDETTQSAENVAENNEQSDEQQIKKPTMRESWRKVIMLRWKELSKTDAWNIGAPVAGVAALGLLCRYFSKNGNVGFLVNKDLQKNKNKLENKLQLNEWSPGYQLPITSGLFMPHFIDQDPTLFLKYCYYQKIHQNLFYRNIIWLDSCSADFLQKCQEAQIDGYSALGAAIIARKIELNDKRDFIRQLMERGFELTEKDRSLAKLELYNSIPANGKEAMILFIASQGDISMLPKDVIRYIMRYMLCPFKEELWLLPENY